MGLLGGIVSAIGGPLVGNILGNDAQNKAGKKADRLALANTRENNALFRETRDLNTAHLSPFMERGNVAGDYYNAMLGLPSTQGNALAPSAQPALTGPTPLNALMASIGPKRTKKYQRYFRQNTSLSDQQKADYLMGIAHSDEQGIYRNALADQTNANNVQAQIAAANNRPAVTQGDAQNAFKSYMQNSDYGFQFGEGSNALNSGYAAQGTLQSGAAMKALEKYRQNLQSGYRGEYLGHLSGQQNMGMSGASALAGVSNAFANNTADSNNDATGVRINTALSKGTNDSAFYGAMGSMLPKFISSFAGGGMG